MARGITRGILVLLGVLVLAVGCATKGFVREELQKSEGKTGEQLTQQQQAIAKVETQVGGVEKQVGAERERIGQATSRIDGIGVQVRVLEGTISETRETATQAKGTADQAMTRAQEVDSRLTRLWSSRYKRNLADTVSVYFGFDKAALDDRAETTLLDLTKQMKENPALAVELEGYTDSSGQREYNLGLSQRRVESVRRFLVDKGVDLARIHFIGLGVAKEGDGSAEDRAKNRRVTVKLFTPQE